MTVNEYWNQINNCEYSINVCESDIRNMNQQIEELEQMISKFNNLYQNIEEAAYGGKRRMSNLATMLLVAGKKIRNTFWEINEEVYTGTEYQRSCYGIEEAIRCIRTKINELENNINDKYRQIGNLNYQISNYRAEIATLEAEEM